jgi:hypothetical protein
MKLPGVGAINQSEIERGGAWARNVETAPFPVLANPLSEYGSVGFRVEQQRPVLPHLTENTREDSGTRDFLRPTIAIVGFYLVGLAIADQSQEVWAVVAGVGLLLLLLMIVMRWKEK